MTKVKYFSMFTSELRSLLNTHASINFSYFCIMLDHCWLAVNEQWQNEQELFRQTIRQALKQRQFGSEGKRLIISVVCRSKYKLQYEQIWQRLAVKEHVQFVTLASGRCVLNEEGMKIPLFLSWMVEEWHQEVLGEAWRSKALHPIAHVHWSSSPCSL